jgi:hypothetical protein
MAGTMNHVTISHGARHHGTINRCAINRGVKAGEYR